MIGWEHDNFEKIWETSHLENSEKISFSLNNSYFLRTQQDWDLVDFEKIKGTSKLGDAGRVSYLSLNSEGKIFFFCIFLTIINFRSINDEKIWETWDLKNYVKNFIFSPNSSYFLRILQNWGHDNFEKIEKTRKILRDIPKKFGK